MGAPMPIHLAFTLSFDDYFAAQRLHTKRSGWARFNWFMGRIFAPVWGVVLLGLSYLMHGPGVSLDSVMFVTACGLFLLAYPFYMQWKFKRCYTRTRVGDGDCTIQLGEDCIRMLGGNTKSEMDWAAVRSIAENEKVFMLYLAPAKFVAIPKRVCSPEQIEQLRSLFANHIPTSA
jgi:hypothetical protein